MDVELCVLDYDENYLAEPSVHDCRDACGDASCDGDSPTVADALSILRAAVGLADCAAWLCDANDDGAVTVDDALRTLGRAVGIPRSLLCRPGGLYCL